MARRQHGFAQAIRFLASSSSCLFNLYSRPIAPLAFGCPKGQKKRPEGPVIGQEKSVLCFTWQHKSKRFCKTAHSIRGVARNMQAPFNALCPPSYAAR
jgi:hypothetical protein